ncbi:2-polyprenylphenol 6-hydroxylase [Magnetospira sp. QH-2]|uniref:2-polyprenylphenol 6-hydroxylase n=1 Tax=Magnetospira sp. (strain QH-2) TaxID=1288970 RepID=UPI0003E813B2|nr:2-polyprenylphenol 6-hydroxylase [Magnetospira sp. QH-2]CCQ75735.1 Ubiquinone biosynthesis protein ubiB [Magnetospira sp. QH-2]
MIGLTRNLLRLVGIAHTLARHDALFLLEQLDIAPGVAWMARATSLRKAPGRPGQRLARALVALGPTFIKLGQVLATRSDLLGEEIAADLTELQDRLSPFPYGQAKAILEQEFGQPLDTLFQSFDQAPVAAASIAQVHFAITTDGREVAVKVLRPDIEKAFERDLDLFRWVADMVEATRPELRRLKPAESVRTFEETVHFEMDLRFEAAAAAELGENFEDDPTFRVPEVDWRRTGQRVLTTERVHGCRFDDREAILAAGHDPKAIVATAAAAFFNQVFRDGLFHGDLHPGNMFVQKDGTLAAVDFGIMGRLDRVTARHLGEMLLAFLTRDYRRAAEVHFEAGWVPADQSVDSFTQACRSIAEPILGLPQNEISMARLLAQLFRITEFFQMEAQPQLLLLQKTMLVAEGAGRRLNPDTNMWILAQPLIEEWMIENLGPQARVLDAVEDLGDGLRRLPRTLSGLETALQDLNSQGLKVHPDTLRGLRDGGPGGSPGRGGVPLWVAIGLAGALIVAIVL